MIDKSLKESYMQIYQEILKIADQFNFKIISNTQKVPNEISLIDIDYEIMNFSISKSDEIKNILKSDDWMKVNVYDYSPSEISDILNDEGLQFIVSPRHLYIIRYYLIGGKCTKVDEKNAEILLKSYLKNKIRNKTLNIELSNYTDWLSVWNLLKNLLNKDSLTFDEIFSLTTFDYVMNNGTTTKFSTTDCFGFLLKGHNYTDSYHVVFSLEENTNNNVSIGVKVIPERDKTLQNFSFYNSKFPTQRYTYKSAPSDLENIIKSILKHNSIVEIDNIAKLINCHIEK
jgi:hypothetical protein